MKVTLTHPSCKEPNVEVVKRTDFIDSLNEVLDPRYQLCPFSLSKAMEIFSASQGRLKLTISAASRNRYILASVVDDLKLFIIGRQTEIPDWRRRSEARSKRASQAFKPAKDRKLVEEDVALPPFISPDAACEVNRILEGRPSRIASLYAEAVLKSPQSRPVLRLGSTSYVALYENPHL